MQKLTNEQFIQLVAQSTAKPRLKRELRFVTSTENIADAEWIDHEYINISDRSGNNGVLVVSLQSSFYVLPYELRSGIVSASTGRSQSIICDICRTWQYGNNSANITFNKGKNSNVSILCCADLKCSLHVRNLTNASHTSRAQLREDMTVDQRVDRLRQRLADLIAGLPVVPLSLDTIVD